MTDQFLDIHPAVAEAARGCLKAIETHGIGSPEHELAKADLLVVAKRVLAEHDADRKLA